MGALPVVGRENTLSHRGCRGQGDVAEPTLKRRWRMLKSVHTHHLPRRKTVAASTQRRASSILRGTNCCARNQLKASDFTPPVAGAIRTASAAAPAGAVFNADPENAQRLPVPAGGPP
jgi:hypothetical protein